MFNALHIKSFNMCW